MKKKIFNNLAGMTLIEVVIMTGVLSTLGLTLISGVTNYTKAGKRVNIGSDWRRLIKHISFVYSHPTVCGNMFNGLTITGPTTGTAFSQNGCIGLWRNADGSCGGSLVSTGPPLEGIQGTTIQLQSTGAAISYGGSNYYPTRLNLQAKRAIDGLIRGLNSLATVGTSLESTDVKIMMVVNGAGSITSCYSYDETSVPFGTVIAIDGNTCPAGWDTEIRDSWGGDRSSGRMLLGAGNTQLSNTAGNPSWQYNFTGKVYAYDPNFSTDLSFGGNTSPATIQASEMPQHYHNVYYKWFVGSDTATFDRPNCSDSYTYHANGYWGVRNITTAGIDGWPGQTHEGWGTNYPPYYQVRFCVKK